MPNLNDAEAVTSTVTKIVSRVRKAFPRPSGYSVDQERAVLHAVCADAEMQTLLQDGTTRDAMALAFIEAIVSADLDRILFPDASPAAA